MPRSIAVVEPKQRARCKLFAGLRRGWASALLLHTLFLGCRESTQDFFDKETLGAVPEKVDFNFHVKPILSDRCFKCHGPDNNARKAGLRFDTEDGAFAALGAKRDHYALVAGDLQRSTMFRRVMAANADERMPPPRSNLTLTDFEKAVLGRWIEQGAEWKTHWSFLPVQRHEPPQVKNKTWPKNSIDDFILARLEKAKLQPAAEAEKEQLLRRLTFDLTGLPPTLAELDSFLADHSAQAYERVVERLLAAPAYGERMATEWLDVARYADTHGYQDDRDRNMSPWRDWVIAAFNRNLAFDQFLTWQLAGDLLPGASYEQKLATGFHRNHMQNQEGGIIDEEYRVEYVADRTNTTALAFMGMTLECARCHDHKYDPITQKEYYQFYAFFNNIDEVGQISYNDEPGPTLTLAEAKTDSALAESNATLAQREEQVQNYVATREDSFIQWQKTARTHHANALPRGLLAHYSFDQISKEYAANLVSRQSGKLSEDPAPKSVEGKRGRALEFDGNSFVELAELKELDRATPFSLGAWLYPTKAFEDGALFAKMEGENNGARGFDVVLTGNRLQVRLTHLWTANAIVVRSKETIPFNAWTHVLVTYDGSSRATGVKIYLNGVRCNVEVKQDNLYRTVKVFGALKIGKRVFEHQGLRDARVDEVLVFNRALSGIEVEQLLGKNTLAEILQRAPQTRTAEQEADLRAYYLANVDARFPALQAELQHARAAQNQVLTASQQVMILGERKIPRPTFVLRRGAYDAPTDSVAPATPTNIMPFPNALPRNRLGLAQWLLDPRHPLTARVLVNRYWQMFFGKGFVRTPGDFGSQGALPTHPELLDWLATEFVRTGWDVKALHKMLVMSATYRQASQTSAEQRERDAENELLSHAPRRRLTAEMMRDQALAVSGLLVKKIGGPSVKPYQPPGLWEEKTSGENKYVPGKGEELYRRSMYTFWKRTVPPPMMLTFDAAERNFCTVKRQSTSTPLQALVLLNDPQFLEAARVLAQRLLAEWHGDPEALLAQAFRQVTARLPNEKERGVLRRLYQAELEKFRNDLGSAQALLHVGEFAFDGNVDPAASAASTMLISTILNMDEASTLR